MPGILAIDYGERRIGFAFGDMQTGIAFSMHTAMVTNDSEAIAAVREACSQRRPDRIMVGLPLNMNGTRGPQAQRAATFAEKLKELLNLPIELWDERLTSREVERTLIAADLSRSRRREVVDKLAAQVLLQSYLDVAANVQNPPSDAP